MAVFLGLKNEEAQMHFKGINNLKVVENANAFLCAALSFFIGTNSFDAESPDISDGGILLISPRWRRFSKLKLFSKYFCLVCVFAVLLQPQARASGTKLVFDGIIKPTGDGITDLYQDSDGVTIQCSDGKEDHCASFTNNEIISSSDYYIPNSAPVILLGLIEGYGYSINSMIFTATVDGSSPGSYYWYSGDQKFRYGVLQPGKNIVSINGANGGILHVGVASDGQFHASSEILPFIPRNISELLRRPRTPQLNVSGPGATNIPIHLSNVIINYLPPVIKLGSNTTTSNPSFTAQATTISGSDPIQSYQWSIQGPSGNPVTETTTANNISLNFGQSGDYVFSVQAFDGTSYSNTATQTITFSGGVPEADLSLSSMRIGQSLFNFRLDTESDSSVQADLVQGKQMVVLAKAAVDNVPTGLGSTAVAINALVYAYGTTVPLITVPGVLKSTGGAIHLGDLATQQDILFDFGCLACTNFLGKYTIHLEIEPTPGINDPDVNNFQNMTVNFYKLPVLSLNLYRFTDCDGGGCYSATDSSEVNAFSSYGASLVRNSFPVASLEMTAVSKGDYTGIKKTILGLLRGDDEATDMYNLCLEKYIAAGTPGVVRQFVGVVSDDYFAYWNSPTTAGISYPNWCSSLVRDGFWNGLAHELGHAVGAIQEDQYDDNGAYKGLFNLSGYFYDEKKEIIPTVSNPGCNQNKYEDIMGPGFLQNIECNWVQPRTYQSIWNGMNALAGAQPSYFIKRSVAIAGIRQLADGAVVSDPNRDSFFLVPTGGAPNVSSASGTSLLEVLDVSGRTLYSTSFTPGVVEMDAFGRRRAKAEGAGQLPFLLQVPALTGAFSLRISSGGQASQLIPAVELMVSAINRTPDAALVGDPTTTRANLVNITESLTNSYLARDFRAVNSALQGALLPAIASSVLDVPTSSPLQMNLSSINSLFSQVVSSINSLASVDFSQNQFVTLSLDRSNYRVGDRAVASVKVLSSPSNPNIEMLIEAQFNGQDQRVEEVATGQWSIVTPSLAAGSSGLVVKTYLIDRHELHTIQEGLRSFRGKIFEIEQKLAKETNPGVIASLNNRKTLILNEIQELQLRMQKAKNVIGSILRKGINAI